ncbi:hypothetical protein BDZ89DRAFT_1136855 [Hymenopellis radicata]|nr:hypothetical protein BDZ89DRAFT_1136855 [Hymenopellis radicata]
MSSSPPINPGAAPPRKGPGRPKKVPPPPAAPPMAPLDTNIDVVSILKRMDVLEKRAEEAEERAKVAEEASAALREKTQSVPSATDGQPTAPTTTTTGTAHANQGPDKEGATGNGKQSAPAATVGTAKQPQATASSAQKQPQGAPVPVQVPRPKGQAGTHYSLATEMGLASSSAHKKQYRALLRNIRDLSLAARLRWDVEWREVPVAEKANLYAVVREQHPIMKRYVNDWATEAIVTQYFRNKRKHNYELGTLEVPERFTYLKNNSDKRDPNGSRRKKADEVLEANRRAKRKEKTKKNKKSQRVARSEDAMEVDDNGTEGGSGQPSEKENRAPGVPHQDDEDSDAS